MCQKEQEKLDMDYFEETDSMKALKKMIQSIDKMIDITNDFKNKMDNNNMKFNKIINSLKRNK